MRFLHSLKNVHLNSHLSVKTHKKAPELSSRAKDEHIVHALLVSEELAYSTILFREAGSHVPIYNKNINYIHSQHIHYLSCIIQRMVETGTSIMEYVKWWYVPLLKIMSKSSLYVLARLK